ncbi:caspase-10 [Erinaceus europaeus]|uniref:Caspase-10 n=1 Tax=Erinaceus europaeus TaxID=9365 RepID=A0A1S3W7M8_ERIEU|nr:caspase-10 [Erinaceus europaeus]
MASLGPSLSSSSEDKFRVKLLDINSQLGTEDLEALKFFCQDLLSKKKLENSRSSLDIFDHLLEEELLSEKEPFLLAELLHNSKKLWLLHHLDYTKKQVENLLPTQRKISLFRNLLYDLSENISSEELAEMKFLMKNDIPNTSMTSLSFLAYLEKQGFINENSLEILEKLFSKCSPSLMGKVEKYKKEKDAQLVTSPKNKSFCQEKGVSSLDMKHFSEALQVSVYDEEAKRNGDREAPASMEVLGMPATISTQEPAVYRMDRKYRGYCVIINNQNFTSMKERRGTDKDAEYLSSIFKWLEFHVYKYDDVTKKKLAEILKEYQKDPGHEDRDCFVFCVLSHGTNGAVYTSDEAHISIREIMSHFTLQQCPGLAHKPKLFFIQACQGKEIQPAVLIEEDALSYESISSSLQNGRPDWVDFLLGMASFPGYVSFRHLEKGSWYIQSLCNHLKDMVPRHHDILTILTAVNKDVSEQADSKGIKKQMPQPSFTLCKQLKFPVPQAPFL